MSQLDLFSAVVQSYTQQPDMPLSNDALYDTVAQKAGISHESMAERRVVGRSRSPVNLLKRKIRWHQQTLKHAGVIELTDQRGIWRLTDDVRNGKPRPIADGMVVLGFSTDLGIAVIADCRSFFSRINEPLHLILTSPPYPLAKPRAYDNVDESRYVDWLCEILEPVVRLMAPGASLCLNVGNDVFMSGSPARSMYQERLLLALHDRFGLYKMDSLVWESPKAPGPVQWASKRRVQLNATYEMVYWLTNDPSKVLSDNRRVLQPHTDEHLRFVRGGGVKTPKRFSDGAHSQRVGAFSQETPGRIPRNVLRYARTKADQDKAYREYCDAQQLVKHGASMPVGLADFLIRFLTDKGMCVADPFAGRLKTGLAAERLGRRWICTDIMADYVMGSQAQFF